MSLRVAQGESQAGCGMGEIGSCAVYGGKIDAWQVIVDSTGVALQNDRITFGWESFPTGADEVAQVMHWINIALRRVFQPCLYILAPRGPGAASRSHRDVQGMRGPIRECDLHGDPDGSRQIHCIEVFQDVVGDRAHAPLIGHAVDEHSPFVFRGRVHHYSPNFNYLKDDKNSQYGVTGADAPTVGCAVSVRRTAHSSEPPAEGSRS